MHFKMPRKSWRKLYNSCYTQTHIARILANNACLFKYISCSLIEQALDKTSEVKQEIGEKQSMHRSIYSLFTLFLH